VQILLRLKYLLYDRRFTLEGAREELYRELTGEYQDLRGAASSPRSCLLDLYFDVARRTETRALAEPPGD